MKKLLLAVCVFFLAFTLTFAHQSVQIQPSQYQTVIDKNELVSPADSIANFVFDMTKIGQTYYYAIPVKFNSPSITAESTTDSINIFLQGGNDNESWSNIDTVTYWCSADTTFDFLETSTAVGYSYLRVHIDGADSISARLDRLIMRFIH